MGFFGLMEFCRKYNIPTGFDDAHEKFFERGINTATDVMTETLYLIPRVARRDELSTDHDKLVLMARKSYPLVARLSLMHENEIASIMATLREQPKQGEPFDAEKFGVRNYGLAVLAHVEQELEERLGTESSDPNKILTGPTIGCPAMFGTNGTATMKTLWDWHVEITESLYRELYGT